MSTFFTSDLHFGHQNLTTALRGQNFEENAELIIKNWNNVVTTMDKVYILGDIVMEKPSFLDIYFSRLKGFKHVILGNHDTPRVVRKLVEMGVKVSASERYKGFILTHIPIEPSQMENYRGNIHGHIHLPGVMDFGEYNPKELKDVRYYNVNTEFYNYTPISYEDLEADFVYRKTKEIEKKIINNNNKID